MRKLMLANIDYAMHTSSEGEQLQLGLQAAGWKLAGVGFDDGCADVKELYRRHMPEVILVHDKRDWDPDSNISFRKDIGFVHLKALKMYGVPTFIVLKDAGGWVDYHWQFFQECGACGIVSYYHPDTVRRLNPWIGDVPIIRTYHTVDPLKVPAFAEARSGVVISGALGKPYPVRNDAVRIAQSMGWRVIRHPGYKNIGQHTADYLREIARYRVHIATASKYDFALRKIIESVACGCTPVTTLSTADALPEIDRALIRVPPRATPHVVAQTVEMALSEWSASWREDMAERAKARYDYLVECARLSFEIESFVKGRVPRCESTA